MIELIHGAYYWLRVRPESDVLAAGDLYIGQCYAWNFREHLGFSGPDVCYFDICGDDESYIADFFEVLEMIEYKGIK